MSHATINMKGTAVFLLLVVSALAEPPVNNRYLPPQAGYRTTQQDRFAPPPQNLAPGPAAQRQTDAVFRSSPQPASNYRPPQRSSALASRPASQYGAPMQAPAVEYGAPQLGGNSFSPASQQYGPPMSSPSRQFGSPASQSRSDSAASSPGYDAPGSRQYLPPNSRSGNADYEDNREPANYSFEYMVKDDASGNDFGHRESRQGDRAEGLYYVLLPDGRKQTVEYEADQDGYRPKISYEELGSQGYDRNSQMAGQNRGSYQDGGYQENGPY